MSPRVKGNKKTKFIIENCGIIPTYLHIFLVKDSISCLAMYFVSNKYLQKTRKKIKLTCYLHSKRFRKSKVESSSHLI